MNNNKGQELIDIKSNKKPTKRKGPPNRMNDLPYKEWMKFQKSFFWYEDVQSLVEGFVYFFTKSVWEDGFPSKILVINAKSFDPKSIGTSRIVETLYSTDFESLISLLNEINITNKKFDYVYIDLKQLLSKKSAVSSFLDKYHEKIFMLLRKIITDEKYCTIVVNSIEQNEKGFPVPWSIALSCRKHLRLRDEKIGLIKEDKSTLYCLNMQATDDERSEAIIRPDEVSFSKEKMEIPTWLIPKPPPRKKHEVLHPAKYPETLISYFIEIFTAPDDNVLDPMVGTGSTVLAAVRLGRNGYGIDLSKEYTQISQERVIVELEIPWETITGGKQESLFPGFELRKPIQLSLFANDKPTGKAFITCGDSLNIKQIEIIKDKSFKYVCTSPPYWSMLKNPGSEGQRARRNKNLPLVYSDEEHDLGNVESYDAFLDILVKIYNEVADLILPKGYMTVVVKNIKRKHVVYPLAWDLAIRLCMGKGSKFKYVGTTLWCQDDVGLKPFAVGIVWVSNTVHHYCLHFKKR